MDKKKVDLALLALGRLKSRQRADLNAALCSIATDSLMPEKLDAETTSCAMELMRAFGLDTARSLAELAAPNKD